MKKSIISLLLALLLFAGCESDSDYVNRVKNMNLDSGGTVEEYVISLIEAEDHCNVYGACTEHAVTLIAISSEKAMLESVQSVNLKYPRIGDIKWEVEGKTSNGKILLATADKYFVKIPTQQDGDYIKLNTGNFTVYDKNTKAKLDDKTNQIGRFKLAYIREIGYTESDGSNQVESSDNEFGFTNVQFYPSGRIKKFTAHYDNLVFNYKDVPINFNELYKNLEDFEKRIANFKDSDNDEWIHNDKQSTHINGLLLSKNITAEEKNKLIEIRDKINDLREEALGI